MSTLQEAVQDGLSEQGLSVSEDRGGLIVRGGSDTEHTVTVWIDETERVVRAETVLCYPVDDFSENLCIAMDQLNEMRVGIAISYQEQQRSVVATSVWTSPSRSPSQNQLHLLIALLHESIERDGEPLSRIAEGEVVWADVADELTDAADSAFGRVAGPAGAKTRHYANEWAEPPTRPMGNIGDTWAEPPTRPMDQIGTGHPDDPQRPADRRRSLPPADELAQEKAPPKTSRLAFQMAISAVDKEEYEKVDMTADALTFGARLRKFLFWGLLIGGAIWLVVFKIIAPMRPDLFNMDALFGPAEVEPQGPSAIEEAYLRRKAMPPGRDLLKLELESPRDFKSIGKADDFAGASLEALGDSAQATLETLIVRLGPDTARNRAYDLWVSRGYAELPGARLKLLRELTEAKRPADVIMEYLINGLKENPPADELIGPALGWASPPAWEAFVTQLGRPGEGSKARAVLLAEQLPRDNDKALALRALILTGNAPDDALEKLIDKRKLEWASGEGLPLLVELVAKDVNQVNALLSHENLDRRALAVDLLVAAKTPATHRNLIKLAKNRETPSRIRLAAISGLSKNTVTEATWTLVLLSVGKEDEQLKMAASRTLRKFPGEEAVNRLKPYFAADKKYSVRHYALRGLGVLKDPSAVGVLIELLKADADPKVRRLAARVLEDYLEDEDGRSSLNSGLGIFREVARDDEDAAVRKAARRLYDSLTGG